MILLLLVAILFSPPSEAARNRKRDSLLDQLGNRVNQALVNPPADQEVCFSPDDYCDVKLVKFIDSARISLDIAIFDINLDQVVHHILVQSKKIPVRIVADRRQGKSDHSLIRTLVKGGAQVRFGKQRGIMHNKFTIVDGKMIETGSFNYTNGAAEKNNENQIYLSNPQVVGRYKERFENIWAAAKPVTLNDLD